jgi:hypothetical protein
MTRTPVPAARVVWIRANSPEWRAAIPYSRVSYQRIMNLRASVSRHRKNARYCGEFANAADLTPPLLMGWIRGFNKNE